MRNKKPLIDNLFGATWAPFIVAKKMLGHTWALNKNVMHDIYAAPLRYLGLYLVVFFRELVPGVPLTVHPLLRDMVQLRPPRKVYEIQYAPPPEKTSGLEN